MRTLPWVLLAAALVLPGCQGRRLLGGEATTGAGAGAGDASGGQPAGGSYLGSQPGRGGMVDLSARDLAGVDAWVDARNAQWIVGDDVLVEASREYFAGVLSVVSRAGAVERTDEVHPDVTIITLTFLMGPLQAAVENNPRVMIGTGLTVSARRTLRVRLFKTTDSAVPVQLRVTATGNASRGRKDKVEQRNPTLQLGGTLRRAAAGWAWYPIG